MLTLLWTPPARPADDERPTAIFLIGPPGSGKTTWRNDYLRRTSCSTFVVSSDDRIEAKMAYSGHDYAQSFRTTDHEALLEMLKDEMRAAVTEGRDIIIDRTNMRRASRKVWRDLLPPGYRRVAVVFSVRPPDLGERLRLREAANGKAIPAHVVAEMVANYQQPTPREFEAVLVA